VSLPAEILTIAASESRAAARRTLRLQVNAQLSRGAVEAEIRNISSFGLLVETTVDLVNGEVLDFDLPEAGIVTAKVVWSRGRLYGCEFKAALPKHVVSAALLRSPKGPWGQDEAALTRDTPVSEENYVGNETDDSSLPVWLIGLVVLMLMTIIGLYALFEVLFVPQ
jgi:hypothetical protein